ncbi:MAG: hypothetical protein BECKG1743D_GA0114223_100485 [Candidatus Kentron sp. G]|nr:MAG: hypothetical protein BECKG1743D_GA0114223_100485 [Candidatus Kentron sp. G]
MFHFSDKAPDSLLGACRAYGNYSDKVGNCIQFSAKQPSIGEQNSGLFEVLISHYRESNGVERIRLIQGDFYQRIYQLACLYRPASALQ